MEALDLLISWGAQISLVVDVTEQHNASVAVSQRAAGRPASTCIDWGLHDSLDAETLSVLRVGGVGVGGGGEKASSTTACTVYRQGTGTYLSRRARTVTRVL